MRVFHWSLVVGFTTAWLFIDDDYETVHRTAGYTIAALVAARIFWGFAGTGYARFAQFVRAPSTVLRYLADIAAVREARYIGHNPAGGMMVVALLAVRERHLPQWLADDDRCLLGQSSHGNHSRNVDKHCARSGLHSRCRGHSGQRATSRKSDLGDVHGPQTRAGSSRCDVTPSPMFSSASGSAVDLRPSASSSEH